MSAVPASMIEKAARGLHAEGCCDRDLSTHHVGVQGSYEHRAEAALNAAGVAELLAERDELRTQLRNLADAMSGGWG